MAAASICALALSLPAAAQAQRAAIDVPAGRLTDSIAILAAQAGISIGAAGRLPDRRTPAIRGQMEVARALELLLAGSGWRARRVSARIWRLEPAPPLRSAPKPTRPAVPSLPQEEARVAAGDIVVTGRKRRELLANADAAIGVVSGDRLAERGGLAGAATVAERIDGLTVTSLGSGRNRLFVRGVADSPFDGFGQAAVSVAVDEARVSYDAPDPDLRLVDVERVELLKGPQGPLYGTGALGGIYRIVTRKPDPGAFAASISMGGTAVQHGGVGSDTQAMVNLPLGGAAALRGVVYRALEPGWIDDRGDGVNRNSGRILGTRIALRAEPFTGWTADLVGAVQDADYRDSQYVDGSDRYTRSARIAEPHDSDFELASLTVHGRIGGIAVTSVSSLTHQELRATYDASASAALGAAAPARYRDERRYSVATQELRLTGPEAGSFSWLAGLSLLDAGTDARGDLTDPAGTRPILTLTRHVLELAAFGEGRLRLGERLSASLGGRLFHASVEDEKREQGDMAAVRRYQLFLSPSASLRWSDGGTTLYLRYAEALRPGGAAAVALGQQDPAYALDEIQTIEGGVRRTRPGLSLNADLFHSAWQNVQADFLRPDGLVTTRNAGDAVDYGAELSVEWRPGDWLLGGGMIAHRGRLTHVTAFAARSDDLRLPVTSDIALRGSIGRRFSLGGWQADADLSGSFTGPSRLSFDPGLDRRMPGRVLLNLGLSGRRGGWEVRTGIENLLDSSADGFAFGNPFAVRTMPQHTPVRPRTLRVTLGRRF